MTSLDKVVLGLHLDSLLSIGCC